MSEPVSVDVTFRGLPVARAVRMVTPDDGARGSSQPVFVEMDAPMPVGTELVLSPVLDGDGVLVKVARVIESSDPAVRAGAQVVVLGKAARVALPPLTEEDVAAAQARAALPVQPPPSSSAPQLAAALAAASAPPAATALPTSAAPVPAPTPAAAPAEAAAPPPEATPEAVADAPEAADNEKTIPVNLKSLEVNGDDKKKGGRGGRKRKHTMIGR